MLLEGPALADVRTQCSQLIAHCSGIMIIASLQAWVHMWFKDQRLVSRNIMACLDTVPGYWYTDADPSIQLCWLPRMRKLLSFLFVIVARPLMHSNHQSEKAQAPAESQPQRRPQKTPRGSGPEPGRAMGRALSAVFNCGPWQQACQKQKCFYFQLPCSEVN